MQEKRKKFQIIILVLCYTTVLISFWFLNYNLIASEKPLEVKYPTIKGVKPTTTDFNFVEYVKYIFTFIIVISGLIAFGALVWQGIEYLTSTGHPEKMKKAKERIKLILVGMLILFFSSLILTTINPNLIVLNLSDLESTPQIPVSEEPKPKTLPISRLERIREIAEITKELTESITNSSQKLKSLTDNCNCNTAQAMCICGSNGKKNGISGSVIKSGFITGSLLGDFNQTSNTLSNFQKLGLNSFTSFLPTGNSLSQSINQLDGLSSQLSSGSNIKIGNNQFSGTDIQNLSSFSGKALNVFNSSYQNIINQVPVYILNNSNYQAVINNYISQLDNQGLFQNLEQKNLFSSQLLNSAGGYFYNDKEFLMVLNGNVMANGGTESFVRQFAYIIDGSLRQFSNSAEYLAIFNQARQVGAFVNNYAKVGGNWIDFAESVVYYYTYGVPEWISNDPQIQDSIRSRFDYFRENEIVAKLDPDVEYFYSYLNTGYLNNRYSSTGYSNVGLEHYDVFLSRSFKSNWFDGSHKLVSNTEIYTLGEFSNSERMALENGVNTAIEYFNPKYHNFLRKDRTYISDQENYEKIVEVYANEYHKNITPEQRQELMKIYKDTVGLFDKKEGTIVLNGRDLLRGNEFSAAGIGPITTAIHEYAHKIDHKYSFSDSKEWIDIWNRSMDHFEKYGSGGWVNIHASQNPSEDFAWTCEAYYSSYGNPAFVSTDEHGTPPDLKTQALIQERFDYLRKNQIMKTQEWPY